MVFPVSHAAVWVLMKSGAWLLVFMGLPTSFDSTHHARWVFHGKDTLDIFLLHGKNGEVFLDFMVETMQ